MFELTKINALMLHYEYKSYFSCDKANCCIYIFFIVDIYQILTYTYTFLIPHNIHQHAHPS